MLPALRSKSESALDAALLRLTGGLPSEEITLARPDTPDHHVSAVRRLPPVVAQLAPFPESFNPRLTQALVNRGVTQLYTHQPSDGHALAGRNVVTITPTASGKTLC